MRLVAQGNQIGPLKWQPEKIQKLISEPGGARGPKGGKGDPVNSSGAKGLALYTADLGPISSTAYDSLNTNRNNP